MTQRLILRHGDCVEILKGYEDGSIGAVVSDPPYGLSFMGKKWDDLTAVSRANRGTMTDWQRPEWETSKAPKFQTPAPAFDLSPDNNRRMEIWHLQWLTEAYRALRPGGVVKAFSGTRTFHRLAAAMHEAGFVDLHVESWNYGSGFPKSLNVGKALDKVGGRYPNWQPEAYAAAVQAAGRTHADVDQAVGLKHSSCYWARTDHRRCTPLYAHWVLVRDFLGLDDGFAQVRPTAEREVVEERTMIQGGGAVLMLRQGERREVEANITAPATEAAQRWDGWGTALKPSWEPVCVGRKPE